MGVRGLSSVTEELARLIDEHWAAPWPTSVGHDGDYGDVVLEVDDDAIAGWSRQVLRGELSEADRQSLASCADEVERVLPRLPEDGPPYFERLVMVARKAVEFRHS